MTLKYAVIVIDPDKIDKLVYVCIGDTREEAIRLVGANNIGVPVFVSFFDYDYDDVNQENWFSFECKNQEGFEYTWSIPREACKSVLYV